MSHDSEGSLLQVAGRRGRGPGESAWIFNLLRCDENAVHAVAADASISIVVTSRNPDPPGAEGVYRTTPNIFLLDSSRVEQSLAVYSLPEFNNLMTALAADDAFDRLVDFERKWNDIVTDTYATGDPGPSALQDFLAVR